MPAYAFGCTHYYDPPDPIHEGACPLLTLSSLSYFTTLISFMCSFFPFDDPGVFSSGTLTYLYTYTLPLFLLHVFLYLLSVR